MQLNMTVLTQEPKMYVLGDTLFTKQFQVMQ